MKAELIVDTGGKLQATLETKRLSKRIKRAILSAAQGFPGFLFWFLSYVGFRGENESVGCPTLLESRRESWCNFENDCGIEGKFCRCGDTFAKSYAHIFMSRS